MSESKVAIVTGAGSGVGRDTALLLADKGYHVALVGRTTSKLQDTADTISRTSPDTTCWILAHDLATAEAPQAIVDEVMQQAGRIDLLANVAGYALAQPVERTTLEQVRAMLDINVTSVMMLTTMAMIASKGLNANTD